MKKMFFEKNCPLLLGSCLFFSFATIYNFLGMFTKAPFYGYYGNNIYVHDYLFELIVSLFLWIRYFRSIK